MVNVPALARLFSDTTTSYKFLFFAALLSAFRDSGFRRVTFDLEELAIGMLVEAWHPCRVFHLSFGANDQVETILGGIQGEPGDPPLSSARVLERVKGHQSAAKGLLRYVPYRLITPFFVDEIRGLHDYQRDRAVRRLADWTVNAGVPLYRFVGPSSIELHPAWGAYLCRNFAIVEAWSELNWLRFLQARNPVVPAVSEKLHAPARRASLEAQSTYWRKVIDAEPELGRCIYSGMQLDPTKLHLDHFLPWTFVCHDALWNLVPVSPSVNSTKGNRLPDPSYVRALVSVQHRGLNTARRTMPPSVWQKVTSSFVVDLRVPSARLLDMDALENAYLHAVRAQLDIAKAVGFEAGWRLQP